MRHDIPNIYLDMIQQPHLLIAGTTGSGKSTILNALIWTAAHRGPEKVRFLLIDPKRVNLLKFAGLPHTYTHARSQEEILSALSWARDEVDRRFRWMEERYLEDLPGSDLYVCIDELMDIMTSYPKQAKQDIQYIAQVGRAAHVHVIACTQSPIREVIPTPIKCNFDARVGLRTRSAQDSRNILGEAGLEQLPMVGQGVYMSPRGGMVKYNLPKIPDPLLYELIEYWHGLPRKRPERGLRGLLSRLTA